MAAAGGGTGDALWKVPTPGEAASLEVAAGCLKMSTVSPKTALKCVKGSVRDRPREEGKGTPIWCPGKSEAGSCMPAHKPTQEDGALEGSGQTARDRGTRRAVWRRVLWVCFMPRTHLGAGEAGDPGTLVGADNPPPHTHQIPSSLVRERGSVARQKTFRQ